MHPKINKEITHAHYYLQSIAKFCPYLPLSKIPLAHLFSLLACPSACSFSFVDPDQKMRKSCQMIMRFLFIIDVSFFFIFLPFSSNFPCMHILSFILFSLFLIIKFQLLPLFLCKFLCQFP